MTLKSYHSLLVFSFSNHSNHFLEYSLSSFQLFFKKICIIFVVCLFQLFEGNWIYNKPAAHLFHEPILAQYVRIRPVQWVGYITLRLELLGLLSKTKIILLVISHEPLNMVSTCLRILIMLFQFLKDYYVYCIISAHCLTVSIKTKSSDVKQDTKFLTRCKIKSWFPSF